jgi:hypothetical protein
MVASTDPMESLAAAAALKAARQRVAVREAVTTWQLAQLLNTSLTIRVNFRPAMIRDGVAYRPALYSRSGIVDLLSEFSGRTVAFPTEPLMTAEEASAFLLTQGVRLSAASIRNYRTTNPSLAPPCIRLGPSEVAKTRYARAELAEFAEHRKAAMITQGSRTDLLNKSVAPELTLTEREGAALLKLARVLKERAL